VQGFRFLHHFLDSANHVKRLLGKLSYSPLTIPLNPLIVSLSVTYLPFSPVNTSATLKGCDKKRWIFRARATASLSSGDSSSMPSMAMISRNSLYR